MNKPISRIILIAVIAVLVTACGKNPLSTQLSGAASSVPIQMGGEPLLHPEGTPVEVLGVYYKSIEQGNIITAIDQAYSDSWKESVKANGNQGLVQASVRALMENIKKHGGVDHINFGLPVLPDGKNPDGSKKWKPDRSNRWTGETTTEYPVLYLKDGAIISNISQVNLIKENGKWGISF